MQSSPETVLRGRCSRYASHCSEYTNILWRVADTVSDAIAFAQTLCGQYRAVFECSSPPTGGEKDSNQEASDTYEDKLVRDISPARLLDSMFGKVLDKRNQFAIVCDRYEPEPDISKQRTLDCMSPPWQYLCTASGKLVWNKQRQYCTTVCRCVNVLSSCDYYPAKKQNFYNICPASTWAKADDDVGAVNRAPVTDLPLSTDLPAVSTRHSVHKRQDFGWAVLRPNPAMADLVHRDGGPPKIVSRQRSTLICDQMQPDSDSGKRWTSICSGESHNYYCTKGGEVRRRGTERFVCAELCRCVNMQDCIENADRTWSLCPISLPPALAIDAAADSADKISEFTDETVDAIDDEFELSIDPDAVDDSATATARDDLPDLVDLSIGSENADASVLPRAVAWNAENLLRRHNVAMICDFEEPDRENVRSKTADCASAPYKYHCTQRGRLTWNVRRPYCELMCRCVNVAQLDPCFEIVDNFYQLCPISPPAAGTVDTPRVAAVTDSQSTDKDIVPTANAKRTTASFDLYTNPLERGLVSSDSLTETVGWRLQRRHDFVLVCDRWELKTDIQKQRTLSCMAYPWGYRCTSVGVKGWLNQNSYCDSICRCTNTNPKCVLFPGTKNAFYNACSKRAHSEIDADVRPSTLDTTERAGETRDSASLDRLQALTLAQQEDVPELANWVLWCTDDDSIMDDKYTDKCKKNLDCKCNDVGEVDCDEKKYSKFDCFAACYCVQSEVQSLRPDQFLTDEIPGDTEPVVAVPLEVTAISQVTASPTPRARSESSDLEALSPKKNIQPIVSVWNMWCTDDDSIDDKKLDAQCSDDHGCHCNFTGTVICDESTREEDCVAACACVQHQLKDLINLSDPPTDQPPDHVDSTITAIAQATSLTEPTERAVEDCQPYSLSCGATDSLLYDTGSELHGLGSQCRHDQICTDTGAMIMKAGADAGSGALCSKYCSCRRRDTIPVECQRSTEYSV